VLGEILWPQFGAAIDMLADAIGACPEGAWQAPGHPAFWHVAYHTVFYLDLYLSDGLDGFEVPTPFAAELRSLDAQAEAPYGREDVLRYLQASRAKCRAVIQGMTEQWARQSSGFDWLPMNRAELLLYNMRHVQHHAGQLAMRIRQLTGEAPPRWVGRARP